jgi:hypothetical protein
MHYFRMLPIAIMACCITPSSWLSAAEQTAEEPSVKSPLNVISLELAKELRPFPEPLPAGKQPGFKFRGIKGWTWTPEQYLEEVPVLAKYKMNFMMNCPTSLFTEITPAWKNEWWKPLPENAKPTWIKVIGACREQGITFCFAVHPQIGSPRPLNPANAEDIDLFYQHYAWAQSQGVKWFQVEWDDVTWGEQGPAAGGAAHAKLVNTILARLRAKDPEAQMLFCPVPYWGDGTNPEHRAYLEAIARDLHPEVYVFWTGDEVVTPRITRKAAESYKSIVKHRLFLWDNYPVNDAQPTLHLGPVNGRDPDLCEVIDGYMSNPMASQIEINRLPLATCADYAYNPWGYDPTRSLTQSILHLVDTPAQRTTLLDLVETYPGFILYPGGTGTNPPRIEFQKLIAARNYYLARNLLRHLEDVAQCLDREFPDRYPATKKTIVADISQMKTSGRSRGRTFDNEIGKSP